MMASKSLVGTCILGTLIVLSQLSGCNSSKGVDSLGQMMLDLPVADVHDGSEVTEGQDAYEEADTIVVHTWDDAYGQQIIRKVMSTQPVQSCMDSLKSQGYRFAQASSFEIEGYGTPEGDTIPKLVQFVTIAMSYQPDTLRQAMYITHTESDIGFVVAPYKLSFVEPEPDEGFSTVTDGVWRLNYPAQVYCNRGASNSVLTIYDYLDCVGERAAGYCAAALIYCGVTGPGYPVCAAKGCAIGAIVAIVSCFFTDF